MELLTAVGWTMIYVSSPLCTHASSNSVAVATEPITGILADLSPGSLTTCLPTAITNTDISHPRPLLRGTGSKLRLIAPGPTRTIFTAANGGRREKRNNLSGSKPHLLSADPS